MSYIHAPCKDCQIRHAGCHAQCDKYAAFRANKEEMYKQAELHCAGLYTSNTVYAHMRANWKDKKRGR